MKQLLPNAALLALLPAAAQAQVGIGTTTPNTKSALEISASDKGLLIPRLTATQRTAIASPPQGLMVYQTDGTASGGPQTGFWYYAGAPAAWVYLDPTTANGLTLPYSGTYSGLSNAFGVSNTGIGAGIVATTTLSTAVSGTNTGSGTGLLGTSGTGTGVVATSTSGTALAAAKSGTQTGRAASITNTNAANDSTATYISTAGDRPALRAVNTATSAQAAIRGVKQSASVEGIGVEGVITSGATGNAAGILGNDQSGSSTGSGVIGLTAGGYGVRGIASANGGYGVSGSATNSYGVIGSSQSGVGVYGTTSVNSATSGAVVGSNTNTSGAGVGVLGLTTNGYGVRGVASASGGYGVQGVATDSYGVTGTSASGPGVYGTSNSGFGVQGSSTSNAGAQGGSTSSYGVRGSSSSNSGVYGTTAAGNTGGVAGVEGASTNSSGIGVLGTTTSGYGVRGEASGSNGYGVFGTAAQSNGIGVYGFATGAATALYGISNGTGRTAYFGQNNASNAANAVEIDSYGTGAALLATSSTLAGRFVRRAGPGFNHAVEITNLSYGPGLVVGSGIIGGIAVVDNTLNPGLNWPATTGSFGQLGHEFLKISNNVDSYGIITPDGTTLEGPGQATTLSNGTAGPNTVLVVRQTATTGAALFATAGIETGRYAGMFRGDIIVTGSINGALKNFKIDHPLDPENKYLVHTSVESAEQLNLYSGNATLDAQGEATVQLPAWFEGLNQDFRYQLTPIGAAFVPYVKEKIRNGQFRIAGQPNAEVSWLLTGTRHDAYARANPTVVEQPKEPAMRGRYLHPAAFGRTADLGLDYQPAAPATKAAAR